MKTLIKPLACAAVMLSSVWASTAHAQAAPPPAPKPYAYSVNLSVTKPKGSAAELALKDKSLPAGVHFSPCNANLDQLAFTIKYDAGKTAAEMKHVYVIFSHPDSGTAAGAKPYLALTNFRNQLTNQAEFKAYATAAGIPEADTYAAAATNLGYAQTEVILGGNIPLEGLPSGLWLVTAIIGGNGSPISFDDPSTWKAWDTVPFMVGKPWQGTAANICL